MLSKIDLTQGGITGTLLRFTLPMIIGSLLQQCYNIADTLIVGQCIGSGALAAVGSAYTLMVFLISILLGLSMGSGTVFSLQYGAGRTDSLRRSIYVSVLLIGTVTLILNIAVFVWIHPILRILQIPKDIYGMMYDYLWIIFWGIGFTFIYNFYAALLRAIGDAVTPLWFLAVSVVLNIGLDLFFILQLDWGIKGAAIATVAAQGVSALGIMGYAHQAPACRLPLPLPPAEQSGNLHPPDKESGKQPAGSRPEHRFPWYLLPAGKCTGPCVPVCGHPWKPHRGPSRWPSSNPAP